MFRIIEYFKQKMYYTFFVVGGSAFDKLWKSPIIYCIILLLADIM